MPDSYHDIEKYQFIHHFVPHPYHKKRASLLSIKALFLYSVLILVFMVTFKLLIPEFFPGVLGYASDISIESLLDGTNAIRAENGLPPLVYNASLASAAGSKASDMFQNDYWSHISPVGTKPWDFIISSNYDYAFAGENLAKNFNSSGQVVDAWYKSASHKENLLSEKYDDVGFAVVNGTLDGYETTLVVQMFGRLRQPTYVATAEGVSTSSGTSGSSGVPSVAEEEAVTQIAQATPPEAGAPKVVTAVPAAPAENVVASINLTEVSKYMLLVVTFFMLSLMALDIWYSRRKAIPKFTGHTFAHITFLVIVLASVWLALSPGRIL